MNITDYFNQHFEIVPADTDDLIEEVLKLRYQVYCIENPLADRTSHTDCKEHDSYDAWSVHHLIRHKLTGVFVASVRLILPNPNNLNDRFPMEIFCGGSFYKEAVYPKQFHRKLLAEVSRFLVSKERSQLIRKISSEYNDRPVQELTYQRKDGLFCYLLLFGLFAAVVRMTVQKNISYWYVGVEPAFHRLLKKFGIDFSPIGPSYEYHGQRFPCLGSTASILSMIQKYRPDLWNFLTRENKII